MASRCSTDEQVAATFQDPQPCADKGREEDERSHVNMNNVGGNSSTHIICYGKNYQMYCKQVCLFVNKETLQGTFNIRIMLQNSNQNQSVSG